MATYLVSTGPADDDLPIHVDDNTLVTLNADNDIQIRQQNGAGQRLGIMVRDVDALTRALDRAQLVQAERNANDTRPMTDDHRKAIFAGLAEVYGRKISRERRLGIISSIVRRPVESLSTRYPVSNPLTRAEATHVLDVLNA